MALPLRTTDTPRTRLYTAEEFMTMELDPDKRYELVRGVIQEMSHPGGEHMLVADNLYGALRDYVRSKRLGRVLPPGLFKLKVDPDTDTIRSPDLTFIPASLISTLDAGAVTVRPSLAVEVYSTHDRPGLYREKFEDYRTAGWNVVWLIYPLKTAPKKKIGTVEIYHLQDSLKPVKLLGRSDQLEGEEILSGFTMPVSDLFDYES